MANVTNMQGLGNNFTVIEGPHSITKQYVQELCGSGDSRLHDGVLVVTPVNETHVKMEYWNADGSEAEMCGNGLRCVARYAVDNDFVEPGEFTVRTKAGDLKAIWDGKDPNHIEVQVGRVKMALEPMLIESRNFYLADVGNPHAATFVSDVNKAPVTDLGPKIETNPIFPNKTNVEFIEVVSPDKIKLRVWERGVGETQACGTGMVAAARLSNEIKKSNLPVTVHVIGGEAKVWLDNEGFCRMIGPATLVG